MISNSIRKEELPPSGIVTRTAAEKERDIQRYAERKRQEENILCLVAQLKERGALNSDARRRRRLEKELAQAKLEIRQFNDDEQHQEEEQQHLHPNKGHQILTPSQIATPSGGEGSSPLISPMKKKGTSGKLKHHVVSPATVSTASITKHDESSFEDNNSAEEMIEGGLHCLPTGMQEANPRENPLQLINKSSLERPERKNNKKRIAKLKRHVINLTNDADVYAYAKQSEHLQEKAIDLTMKFYVLEEEMEKKVDVVDDLIRYKQFQNEKIESLEREVEELMGCIQAKEDTIEAFRGKEARLAHIKKEKCEDEYVEKQNLINDAIEKIEQQKTRRGSLKQLGKMKGLEGFIYQFSCRECREETYVVSAATKESLKQTALEIIEQSARLATIKKAGVSDSSSTSSEQNFVQHLVSHIPTTVNSKADALLYYKRIIKAEKLKRKKNVD